MLMNAPDFDLRGHGQVHLAGALDIGADIVLSDALWARANTGLGAYAREGTRVFLPLHIGGTLEEPKVGVDAGSAASRAAGHAAEEAGKSLFKKLFGGK